VGKNSSLSETAHCNQRNKGRSVFERKRIPYAAIRHPVGFSPIINATENQRADDSP